MIEYDKALMGPAMADSCGAEMALVEEFERMRAEANKPIHYTFNVDKLTSIKDVKEFIREMGIGVTLYPGVSLEMLGKRPEWWTEVSEPVDGEVEDVTDIQDN